MAALDFSSIENKIPSISFDLFRYWSKEIGIHEKIIIKTEQILIQDFKEVLSNAITALNKKDDLESKSPGWDVGFIIGFIDGNLGKNWHHEYIVKNSEAYKTFIALRAIENCLTFDEVCKVRIDEIYKTLINSDSNIQNLKIEINKTDFDLDKLDIIKMNEEGKVMAILNNQIIKLIKQIASEENTASLPIRDFLTLKEIEQLIADNKRI